MEEKMDFLSQVENQDCYLYGAIKTLEIVAEDLSRHMIAWEKIDPQAPRQRAKSYGDALFTILRELDRIQEALDAAIEAEYQDNEDVPADGTDGGE